MVSMAVLQHGIFLDKVGVVIDLEVIFSFWAPVFAMSIMNLIYCEKSVFEALNTVVIAVSKLSQSME